MQDCRAVPRAQVHVQKGTGGYSGAKNVEWHSECYTAT